MKPIIILSKGAMTPENIKLLNDNDLCVVECDNPATVKFVDPIPAMSSRNEIEAAAIALSRKLLSGSVYNSMGEIASSKVAKLWVDLLVAGTTLDPRGTKQEQEQRFIDEARIEELRKIGREEARAEAAKKKAEKAAKKVSEPT